MKFQYLAPLISSIARNIHNSSVFTIVVKLLIFALLMLYNSIHCMYF